ncbi:hypothetical protein ACJBY2_11595, partial [Streptococcus suis]
MSKTFNFTRGTSHIDDWLIDIVTEKYPVCKEIKQMADLVIAAISDPEIYVYVKKADSVVDFINK